MPHRSQARATLSAMIGDDIHHLPPRLVAKLEAILARHGREAGRHSDDFRLSVVPVAADGSAVLDDEATATAMRRSGLAHVYRKLNALCATLEALHAAYLDQVDGLADALPGEHIVEGLVVASWDLAESARDVLDRITW